MGTFLWFPCLLPELWSLNCQKLCPFCIFLLISATNLSPLIAVYVYAFERSRFALSENGIGYYAMTYSLEDISVEDGEFR